MIRKLLAGGVTAIVLVCSFASQSPDAFGKEPPKTKEGAQCVLKCVRAHGDQIAACAKAKCEKECPKDKAKAKDKETRAVCKACVDKCSEPFKKEITECENKCPS